MHVTWVLAGDYVSQEASVCVRARYYERKKPWEGIASDTVPKPNLFRLFCSSSLIFVRSAFFALVCSWMGSILRAVIVFCLPNLSHPIRNRKKKKNTALDVFHFPGAGHFWGGKEGNSEAKDTESRRIIPPFPTDKNTNTEGRARASIGRTAASKHQREKETTIQRSAHVGYLHSTQQFYSGGAPAAAAPADAPPPPRTLTK